MIKSVFITAYKRERIFFNTLKKLKNCKKYEEFKKLVIYQDVSRNILKKIKKIDPEIEVIKTQYNENLSSLYKICHNSYLGFTKCFEDYKSKYVICLEDDVLPAYDFLKFHNDINLKYYNDQKFFAVNSFSKEFNKKSDINLNFAYSKFTYGIGKGWSISNGKWPILKKMYNNVISFNPDIAYDSCFEADIKTKYFVIMPYRSRCIEQASNGMHSKIGERNQKHWINWRKSFLNKKNYKIKNYTFIANMQFTWRKDCLNFNAVNIFLTKLKYTKYYILKIMRSIIGYKNYYIVRNRLKNISRRQ